MHLPKFLHKVTSGSAAGFTAILATMLLFTGLQQVSAANTQIMYNGQPLTSGTTVVNPMTVSVVGDGITAAKFYAGTTYYTKVTSATPSFTYPTLPLGSTTLKVVPIIGSSNQAAIELTVAVSNQAPNPTPTPTPTPTPPSPTPTPTPTPPPPTPQPTPTACIPQAPVVTEGGNRQVAVSNSAGLKQALADARAGDTITLADGVYESSTQFGTYYASFGLARSGTAELPITIQGSSEAKIRGNGLGGRYGFELYGAQHVILKNFTVFEASKGIMFDGSSNNVIDGVTVATIGAEGVHFRAISANNIIRNSTIRDTGMDKQNFGEGIYVGSAGDANWRVASCDVTDASSNNQILDNTVLRARAESVDIKEGTVGTIVRGNSFIGDQTAQPAAPFGDNSGDSWVDVKGNYSIIENNTGSNSLNHGFETHSPLVSWYTNHPETPRVLWGAFNIFRNNIASVNNAAAASNPEYTGGYGFSILNSIYSGGSQHNLGNVVYCDNTVTSAVSGYSNISCTP